MNSVLQLKTVKKNVAKIVETELSVTGGLLRLAPTWVPRAFLQPGKRLKLHPDDLYAYGLNRGGIDERWFASTTPAANEGRVPDEGLSYVVAGKQRFTLQQAVAECGATIIGSAIWKKYKKWPVYSKFFDNMGPIPHHMHQSQKQAALVGQEGKPESYYFPPQHNNVGNNFPYTFMGFEPGTTKAQVRKCLEDWNNGDNGILDLSKAYRLKVGSGWLIDPVCAARSRFALHLRAAVGQRRLRHVSESGRRPRSAVAATSQRHAKEIPQGSRLHRRAARLGQKRRSHVQGQPLPRAGSRGRNPQRRLRRSLDRLWRCRRRTAFHRQGTDGRSGRQMPRSRTKALTASSACKASARSTDWRSIRQNSSASTNSPKMATSSPKTSNT